MIDETDRMLEKGHFEELHKLLEVLNADEKKKSARQNFVFSATLAMVHDIPKRSKMGKSRKKITSEEKLAQVLNEHVVLMINC